MLTIEYAKNCVWFNEEHTAINMIVKFVEMAEELPFLAMPTDPEQYGRDLFYNAEKGDYGTIAPYVPPPPVEQPTTNGTQTL